MAFFPRFYAHEGRKMCKKVEKTPKICCATHKYDVQPIPFMVIFAAVILKTIFLP